MRDLTPQEIADAPDWAIEYWIGDAGIIRWSDKNNYQWDNDGKKLEFSSYGFRTETQLNLRKEFDISVSKPALGVDCVIWCSGTPMIDRLTDEDHHEAYWEESLYAYGDEDCFVILVKPTAGDLL